LGIPRFSVFGFRLSNRWSVLLFAVAALNLGPAAEPETRPFQVAFSSSLFTDINENDAKAAVKAWVRTVAAERNVPTHPEVPILKGIPALSEALRSRAVDAVGITTVEYAALSPEIEFAPIFVTYNSGRPVEQYYLLVHQGSGIERLPDLRGRSLVLHNNSRLSLASPWLDTLLVEEGCPPAATLLGKFVTAPKLAQVVLPVFFRQTDACLVTRTGFETMVELNPQLGRQLKILAASTELVASVFCFRADYAPPFHETLLDGLRELHNSAAGKQVLTVFQSERIEDQPASCLASALELMARHAQLGDGTQHLSIATAEAVPGSEAPKERRP